MKSAVILCPGLNRERDMIKALKSVTGHEPVIVWHSETTLPKVDLVVIPGGFSYGDYLRCGAIAARAPVINAMHQHIAQGRKVLGVCNGFQILTETGVLPGALMRNAGLKFVCHEVKLKVENATTFFTQNLQQGDVLTCPVAHHDGNYFADADSLAKLEDNNQIVFRYADNTNPNGSAHDIAGITNKDGNVIGMMPHPENMIEALHGRDDCRILFESLLAA